MLVTDSSSVFAFAPGYVAVMMTDGGAMVGYCEIGSWVIEIAPARMMNSASTQAKTGRSMKNFAMRWLLVYCLAAGALAAGALAAGALAWAAPPP